MALCKTFLIFLLGVCFSFNASAGMFDLVSSLNIEEGLGTTSLAVGYGASLLSAPILPWLGHRLGCKALMILATTGYLVFILGNVHTSSFTLIPAGVTFGLAESWAWTAMPIITTTFAERRSTTVPHKLERYTRYYTGVFYMSIEAAAVIGNGITFAILSVDRSLSGHNNVTTIHDYSVCGANDCQLPNVTQVNIDQYKPVYPATRFVLIGLFGAFCVISIILYAVYLPNDLKWPIEEKSSKKVKHENSSIVESEKTSRDDVENSLEMTRIPTGNDEADEVLLVNDDVPTAHKPDDANNDSANAANVEIKTEKNHPQETRKSKTRSKILPGFDDFSIFISWLQCMISGWALLRASFSSTWEIFICRKHLLIAPLAIYHGMTMSFTFGEVTRAYASCILGVDKVGVSVMVHGSADCLFSFLAGKAAGRFGRNFPFLFAFFIDALNYIFCLTWNINENNTWLVYLLFLSFGISDGVWQTLITALYGEYFIEKQKFAYNLWNVVVNIGLLAQFAISTLLCVYVKLYLQLGVLTFAMLTYGVSQLIYYPDECGAVCRSTRKQTGN